MPLPNGWTLPRDGAPSESSSSEDREDGQLPEHRCLELCPICRTADVLRAAGPPELRGQLDDVGREALLTLRALIDHYLERIDEQPSGADRVEDIPID
jgi:hypothetical protein